MIDRLKKTGAVLGVAVAIPGVAYLRPGHVEPTVSDHAVAGEVAESGVMTAEERLIAGAMLGVVAAGAAALLYDPSSKQLALAQQEPQAEMATLPTDYFWS